MQRKIVLPALAVLCLGVASCAEETPTSAAAEDSGFRPTATIQDIMESVVDPAADFMWESVATISNEKGVEDRQPRTDAEWAAVRNNGITLMEATNLLIIEGRMVVAPGKVVADSQLEGISTAEEIQKAIDSNRAAFIELAHGLHDTAAQALAAVEKRDVEAFLVATEKIDEACENCHVTYWYPNAPVPTQTP
jgi:hypothetical protein